MPDDLATGGVRIDVAARDLLEPALARLRTKTQYARVLDHGSSRARALGALLDRAADGVAAIARPVIVLRPVTAEACAEGVRIAGRVSLAGADLARDASLGGRFSVYLATLGYDQSEAFERLGRDYAAHHVQTDLGREMLLGLGRQAFAVERARAGGARVRRGSVLSGDACGDRRVWDPARVQDLLGVLEGDNPGVSVTDTGCFRPLHSLLGLTIRLP